MSAEMRSDVTVVGGGVAGLWSAKEMMDQGLHINLVEKAPYLASGATTRNEGWLHAGTYHALAIEDAQDAANITARTRFGHQAILDYAPEAIEHDTTYAFISNSELAARALERWGRFNVPHRAVDLGQFARKGIDVEPIAAAYEVEDASFDSRAICAKLALDITSRGGAIFASTDFEPIDETHARIRTPAGEHILRSDCFVVAAGAGTKAIFEGMTGEEFPIRYFKSHLALAPRLSRDNYFYIDPYEAGVMSHGRSSIVGINREAVQVDEVTYDVLPDKAEMVIDALARMFPRSRDIREELEPVACVKVDVANPDMANADPTIVLQDLNVKVFEPVPGYVCALPGKMTEAPYLAKVVADHVLAKEFRDPVGVIAASDGQQTPHEVTMRPADHWMARRYPEGDATPEASMF